MASHSLEDADPRLAQAFTWAKGEYEIDHPGTHLIITCTYRSPEEQWELYQQGRTKPGSVITQLDGRTKRSNHNCHPSRAIDFAVVVGGKITWSDTDYLNVGPYMERHGLVWGGRWKTLKDYPHVELPKEG